MNGQLNVTPITEKQAVPPCHFTINAVLSGFPITIEGDGRAADLKLIIERLQMIGAEPPCHAQPIPVPKATQPADDAPVCEFHGKMRRGNHGWFCPKKMGDGSYCKSKA